MQKKLEIKAMLKRHDKNYILVIFIITVCSSVAFTNCDSRHPWLAANAVFYKEVFMGDFKIRKAEKEDISVLKELILGLARHERRPQDVTGSEQRMCFWLFERKIASALIAELDGIAMGYAIYYPVYGSYAASARVHLEDIFIKPEFQGNGYGTKLLSFICRSVLAEGFSGMEWNALDFNKKSIGYYLKLGAKIEKGRTYFSFSEENMKKLEK